MENINIKEFVRDGLYEVCELGTVVLCLRKDKYIQFLDLDNIRINRIKNGKWIVELDLSTISQLGMTTYDITQIIESLPDEVTLKKYNLYKNKGEDYRFVELNNCEIISINSTRNYPYGFPYSMGAWASLIQKDIINKVERSVSDRLIKQILILYVGTIGGDKTTSGSPVPKTVIEDYFSSLKNLLLKKEQNSLNTNNTDFTGTGLVSLPEFFKLEPLKVDTDLFTKDLYDKIFKDIYENLGISPSLISGIGDANYSGASLNSEKIYRYIFGILEQFEKVINNFISNLLPSNLSCKFYFEKSTFLDRDKYIDNCKDLYLHTGLVTPWLESVMGNSYHFALGMKRYENEVLKLDEIFNPPLNFYNQSGNNDSGSNPGRKKTDDLSNPNTEKTRKNDSNSNPSPGD